MIAMVKKVLLKMMKSYLAQSYFRGVSGVCGVRSLRPLAVASVMMMILLSALRVEARELTALGSLEEGVRAYQAENYRRAYRYWILLAQRGVARAQHNVGVLHLRGLGLKKNEKAAFEWFRRAAKQDFVRAQHNLGWMYQNGIHVERNIEQAKQFYEAAADKRFTLSEARLGEILYNNKDYKRARVILLRAARKGDRRAQFLLGEIFINGFGVDVDREQALRWYRSAAYKNEPSAQYQLARLYIEGQNDAQAITLLKAAAVSGHKEASNDLGWMFVEGRASQEGSALNWFLRAARQELKASALNIAALYSRGQEVEQNDRLAYMWMLIAEQFGGKGEEEAAQSIIEAKKVFAEALTPDERKQAEVDAQKWLADRLKNKKAERKNSSQDGSGDIL